LWLEESKYPDSATLRLFKARLIHTPCSYCMGDFLIKLLAMTATMAFTYVPLPLLVFSCTLPSVPVLVNPQVNRGQGRSQ
jgi:hypothetical protein